MPSQDACASSGRGARVDLRFQRSRSGRVALKVLRVDGRLEVALTRP
jgi:hypothetical protein